MLVRRSQADDVVWTGSVLLGIISQRLIPGVVVGSRGFGPNTCWGYNNSPDSFQYNLLSVAIPLVLFHTQVITGVEYYLLRLCSVCFP